MNLTKISIATFNLFNLNEPGRAIYSNQAGWSQVDYDKKIAWTARQLQLLQADIVGFQELWHADSLRNSVAAAGLTEHYDVLVPPDANGTHIVCASAVRKGLLTGTPEWISNFPSYSRYDPTVTIRRHRRSR